MKQVEDKEKEFNRSLLRARIALLWHNFYTNKVALVFTILGVVIITISFFLLGWYLQGQDVLAILLSPLAMLWYVIILVAFVVGGYWLLTRTGRKES